MPTGNRTQLANNHYLFTSSRVENGWRNTLRACRWPWEPNLEEPKFINTILLLEGGGFQQTDLNTDFSVHSLQSRLRSGKGGGREAEEKKAEESPGTGR